MPVLAFADELYLLGGRKAEVEQMTEDAESLESHGLALQPGKCAWFAIPRIRRWR